MLGEEEDNVARTNFLSRGEGLWKGFLGLSRKNKHFYSKGRGTLCRNRGRGLDQIGNEKVK